MNVKDLLDYEALPEETKRLAEAYFAEKIADALDEAGKDYDSGYEEGLRDAECDCGDDDELQEKIAVLEAENLKLEERIEEQDDELRTLRASVSERY